MKTSFTCAGFVVVGLVALAILFFVLQPYPDSGTNYQEIQSLDH